MLRELATRTIRSLLLPGAHFNNLKRQHVSVRLPRRRKLSQNPESDRLLEWN